MKISGSPWATVIGAAADTCYRELTVFRPTVYWPPAQFEAAPGFLAVRTAGDPIALAAAIRNAGQAASPGVTFSSLRRLDDYSSEPLARSRVTAALFAGICLLLFHDRPVRRRDGLTWRSAPARSASGWRSAHRSVSCCELSCSRAP